jgi:hypothetical protein
MPLSAWPASQQLREPWHRIREEELLNRRGVTTGASPIALRRGDAIEVPLDNNRRFTVAVDDAATGAALLNGLVARLARKG